MGTAANMNYVAIATEADADVEITAVVTAGVQTNAVCAGDPASWRETPEGISKVAARRRHHQHDAARQPADDRRRHWRGRS